MRSAVTFKAGICARTRFPREQNFHANIITARTPSPTVPTSPSGHHLDLGQHAHPGHNPTPGHNPIRGNISPDQYFHPANISIPTNIASSSTKPSTADNMASRANPLPHPTQRGTNLAVTLLVGAIRGRIDPASMTFAFRSFKGLNAPQNVTNARPIEKSSLFRDSG